MSVKWIKPELNSFPCVNDLGHASSGTLSEILDGSESSFSWVERNLFEVFLLHQWMKSEDRIGHSSETLIREHHQPHLLVILVEAIGCLIEGLKP